MADVEKLNIDSIIARLLEGKRYELFFFNICIVQNTYDPI